MSAAKNTTCTTVERVCGLYRRELRRRLFFEMQSKALQQAIYEQRRGSRHAKLYDKILERTDELMAKRK